MAQNVRIVNKTKVRWLEGGRWRQQTCPDESEAQKLAGQLSRKYPTATPGTIGQAFQNFLTSRPLSPASVGVYRRYWRALDGINHLPVEHAGIQAEKLEDAIRNNSSSENHRRTLKKLLKSVLAFETSRRLLPTFLMEGN